MNNPELLCKCNICCKYFHFNTMKTIMYNHKLNIACQGCRENTIKRVIEI